LEFALETTKDMLKGETGLARGAHTAAHAPNPCNTLANVRRWPPLLRAADEVELGGYISPGLSSTHECMRVRLLMLLLLLKEMLLLLLLLLMLFSTSRDLGILF
jgi:hypothetical protein